MVVRKGGHHTKYRTHKRERTVSTTILKVIIVKIVLQLANFVILTVQVKAQENILLDIGEEPGIHSVLQEFSSSLALLFFNQNFVAGTGKNKSVFNGKAQLGTKVNGKNIGLSRWTLVAKAEYNFRNALDFSWNVLIPKKTAITFPGFKDGERFDRYATTQ